MDDYYTPPPGQLLTDILTLAFFVIVGLYVWVIASGYWQRFDKWRWQRRRARWAREAKLRGE